jgi:hypothetical protein
VNGQWVRDDRTSSRRALIAAKIVWKGIVCAYYLYLFIEHSKKRWRFWRYVYLNVPKREWALWITAQWGWWNRLRGKHRGQ